MVLNGLLHSVELLWGKPLLHSVVLQEHTPRGYVVLLSALTQPYVVPRSNGIDHIEVHFVVCCERKATLDDTLGVVPAMCGIVVVVEGEYMLLDVGPEFVVHTSLGLLYTPIIHAQRERLACLVGKEQFAKLLKRRVGNELVYGTFGECGRESHRVEVEYQKTALGK